MVGMVGRSVLLRIKKPCASWALGYCRLVAFQGKRLGPTQHSPGGLLQTLLGQMLSTGHTPRMQQPQSALARLFLNWEPRFPDGLSCLQPVSWIIGHWGTKRSLLPAVVSKGTILSSFTLTTEKASSQENSLLASTAPTSPPCLLLATCCRSGQRLRKLS